MVRIIDDSGTYTKCILDPYDEELGQLEAAARAEDWERELAVQLMGRCGLRADEVTYPTRDRLRWSSAGECWLVEVRGKDTSGGDGKTRDDVRTMMSIGGWSNYDAIEPYLGEPTESKIGRSMSA